MYLYQSLLSVASVIQLHAVSRKADSPRSIPVAIGVESCTSPPLHLSFIRQISSMIHLARSRGGSENAFQPSHESHCKTQTRSRAVSQISKKLYRAYEQI